MTECCQQQSWSMEEVEQILDAYQGQSSALIEVLHQVQHVVGYLPREIQVKIAKALDVSLGEVYSVISFYSNFNIKPKGKHQICVCKGTACYVKGSPEILQRLEKELDIEAGDTTDDGKYSLEVVRCLGACGLGPVMTVDGNAHGSLKPEKAVAILQKYN
ncbi:NADH-quinone oxidoreductase subunit NuoE [Dehalobacterium formicoaceticum]|uniref:NADH-quinone oxidoreductase subunit NuoE n=1 Tax=Dehalobacterium formicoaceticum TaxID=51515 RepID=A0ABT1Y308_9FIRM|nr:NADH-quinone oxidoreductase subunit NuoE [Dehalobacterium formicoaceticum]MCR6544329.1 NADH-quinone oxidoreductase subunit NuoE [Dehalobacterium formicoaceticum]